MNVLFQRVVLSRLWLTFVVLGASFVAGALGTLNLVSLLVANLRLLHDFGLMAVMDGGLRQSFELLCQGLISGAAYVVFKTCEHRLSDWLGHGAPQGTPVVAPIGAPADAPISAREDETQASAAPLP